VAHEHHVPDQCTVFSFNKDFYERISDRYKRSFNGFFGDRDTQSILTRPSMASEYLHYRIFQSVQQKEISSLQIDSLVLELVDNLFNRNQDWADYQLLSSSQKQNYLSDIEQAKRYLQTHFTLDISLADIASACYMSKFHFARIFRQITGITPYQYLMCFRLNHAAHLLKNSSMPVTQVAFDSGFNNSDHFSATFKTHYEISPSVFRREKQDF
jgi:AraC-like DNA-binding protein